MKKLYTLFLLAFAVTSTISAQKTLVTENFGSTYAHNESMSTNSSGWTHTGTGDFVHKIVSGAGASGSNCFAQLGTPGAASASHDIQLYAGNTYEFKAYVKTVNSRIYVTLRINSGGVDVATSGNTSANGAWEELSCSYTPAADEMASIQLVKTQGQLVNIDKIKVTCTSCSDDNYVFDFNDSKEGFISGGGCTVTLGNDAVNMNATGTFALMRSGAVAANLNLNTADFDRARVVLKPTFTPTGVGKLYFYTLAGGNAAQCIYNVPVDFNNTTTFQTVDIDLTQAPATGTYAGDIARVGLRTPWGITSGDVCQVQRIELYNNPPAPIPALTLTGIMDFGLGGSSGKAIMLTANQSISDLSVYGMGSANNGGGTDNQEYTFPAVSVSAGEHIVVCRDQAALSSYFAGCLEQFNGALLPTNIIENSSFPDGNGNDAYELFHNGTVIETYGDISFTGGSSNYNLPWVYRDSWAWKDTAAANVGNWVYGGDNCSDNSSSTQTSNCPFPLAITACVATYDVTLKVNTANITVGANGMYAGGGFLGGSDALQLTDADGDGTWEGVATISAGSGPNYYAFFNSPTHGSDWGTKENLAGQTCGISSNYNDRVLPTITSDTTIQHCYGNCAFDGTCTAPVSPTYDLTLSVNTASITVGANGMYAGGGVLGDAMAVQLFDADGDGTWTGTVTMNTGVTGNYIFLNSPSNGGDWGAKEDLNGLACSDPANYNDRILPYISADTTMLHCFGSCESDGTCPAPPSVFFNVTFQVDASNITVGANGMYAGGGVLGDAMAYPLSDADGDGVWEATISLADGTSGNYIFLNSPTSGGDWGAKEDLNGLACSDPSNYNDRILASVTADATLPVVCFGTCDATCPPTNDCGVNGTYSYGNNENASNAVGFTANAGDYITLDFTAGVTENGWDYWFVNDAADGTGNTLATGTGSIVGSNTSTTGEISFYVVSDASVTGQTFVYSVSCSAPPSCPDPSGLTSSNITSSSSDFSWTAGGSETAWNIEYGPNGFTQGSGTTVAVTTNPYSLTGLTAATAYDVYLQGDCGNGDLSQWVGPISINTLCPTASAPYLENFDAGLSSCWAQAQNDDFNWTLDANGTPSFSTGPSDDISGGGNYMYIETSSGASGYIATLNTVGIDLSTLTTPELRFFSHMYGATTGSLNVDISNDGGATYTQIFTKSGDQGNQWNEEMIDLSSYSGVVHFSISAIKGTSYTGDIAIDNFEVRETPSCLNPNSLSASNVTNNSLDFGWTAGGNETAWNVEYGTSGFALGTGTLTAVSSNPTNISGLTGNTSYDLYVQADCGSSSVSPWAGPFTVTTLCDAFTAPYLETFDATTTIPSCWTETQTSGSGWVFSGNPGYDAGSNGRASGTYAWIDFSGTDVGAVLTSPTIDYSSLTTPQLRFFYFSVNSNSADINDLFVEVWDGSAWNTISTISVNNSGWAEHTVALTGPTTSTQFRFRAESGGGLGDYFNDILIDDIEVREAPSCQDPSGLTVSNVLSSSVDLSWTAGGTEAAWNVEYGTVGFSVGTGTLVAVTSTTTTITGLSANNTYDFYVQADCGNGDLSLMVGPTSTTTSPLPAVIPYCEDFESGSPSISTSINAASNASATVLASAAANSSSYGVQLTGMDNFTSGAWSGGSSTTTESQAWNTNTTCQSNVSFNVDATNESVVILTFDLRQTYTFGPVYSWFRVTVDGIQIGNSLNPTSNSDPFVNHSYDLSAYAGTSFNLKLEHSGKYSPAYSPNYPGDNSFIDNICISAPSCLAPSALAISNISSSSADLSWTAGGTETAWNVEYGSTGFALGSGTLTPTSTTSLSMTSLTDLTTYDVYVQSDCGSGQTSSWTGPLTFTTPIINGCNHTLNMIDSWGDGWNGSAVDVTVNGVTVVSGATIPSGFTGAANFSASTGSTVALANWVTGSYTGEVSWNITDVNGTIIASGVHADLPSVNGNCQPPSFNDPLVGTWKLAEIPGAFAVGPNQGDGSWWSNSLGDITTRACLFDDSINFDSTGLYSHFMDGNTWVESWQDGASDGCRTPVAPHDGSGSYSYYYDSSTNILTINGVGGHLGYPRAYNTNELTNPQGAPSSISYILSFSNNGNTLTADIQSAGGGTGWWRFIYNKTTYQAPPSSYNVTLKVNTASITVGPNGMYAGGGVLGDAMAIPLSDADGDGTWEGIAQFPAAGGHYIFLNSPSNGGDWGAKEDLTGLPCGDPNSYNDRLMPSLASDTIVLHCFGSCETDGTCPAPPPVPTCNYTIDMQDSWGDGWNGASVDVAVNGTVVANWGLATGSAGSDSIATINGDIVDFSFNSGNYDNEITFQITDPTGSQLGSYGINPTVGLFLTDTSNAICQPTTVNVSFQVDMNQVTAAFTTPEVNGSWNNWSAGTPMSDANGDGVWDATIALLSGNYEYKFAADGWTIQEMNDPNGSCTNGDPIYTNRVLTVGTVDMVTPNVCWGSCTPCFYSPQPPVGVNCGGNGTPGLAFSDDIVPANGWSGDLGGNGYWNVGTGGTTSGSTGPTGAHSGSDYLYFESSTGGLDTATAVTPMIDLSVALSDAELTFWMHAYGVAIGTLDVGVSTSATGPFTSLYTNTGAVQTPSDPWAQIGINLASYVGQQIYVGFTYMRDVTGATSFQGDLAIDLVEVNACFNCLAPSGLTASNVTATSADLSWTAGGTEPEWFLIVNGAGTSQTSTTASLTGLMPNMAYTAQVHAVCAPGDTSAASPAITFNTLCNASLAPTNETFDAGFSNCWSQDTADTFDWTVDAGGTPSGGTGPSDDFTGGGNYMYTEASLPRAYGDVATMYSEVIDVSGLTNPELRFLNHMYGTAIGTLEVDLWDASTGTVVGNVFTHTGDRGNQWNEELIMLSTTATLVQFSITATLDSNATGQTWPGDIAIDEFGVREAAANDLALVAAAVASGCDLTATEPIELWVVNQGLVAESAFDLSYAVNGGTPVVENITSTVNPGDTLKYVFTATADMTADGVYNLDFACVLATDNDPADNTLMFSAENYYTPMAPMSTMGDSICFGDTAYIGATGDGHIRWYDAATAGNLVEEGDFVGVTPSTTTSYYAEAVATEGYDDDFESYTAGDLIAQSSNVWEAWTGPNGGGADDASVSNAQASSGSNSLYLNNADGDDVVLPFGEAFSSGKFFYSMDMYIVTDAYFNFQADVNIGTAWAFDVFLTGGSVDVQVGGTSVLTGAYTGTNPTGSPVWFNIEFEADLNTGTWELFTNGTSQGIFIVTDPVASVNLYANTGNEYYIDDVEWSALKDDACVSATRTEAVVTVLDCSNILELAKGSLDIYPNPNNGLFTISNSEDIVKVTVTDVHGKIVQSINEINLSKVDVDLTELERGMYMINVETNNGTLTESVIVQ